MFGNKLYVSMRCVEELLPYNTEVLLNVEKSVADLAQKHRALGRKVSSHGAKIRKLQIGQQLTTDYLAQMAELNRVTDESEMSQNNPGV